MQAVEFVAHKEKLRRVPVERYQLKPKGRRFSQWLQRLAWRFLQRQGALKQDYDELIDVQRYTIDTRDFMRNLFEQRANITGYFDIRPTRLLVGSEDYAELMHDQRLLPHVEFTGEYMRDRTVVGLKVEVVPWMRGMVVMP